MKNDKKIGEKFGRLLVLKFIGLKMRNHIKASNHKPIPFYECRCECGTVCDISGYSLLRSNNGSKSCGCLRVENRKQTNTGRISTNRNSKGAQMTTIRDVWRCNYKDGISINDFITYSQMNCFYCNSPPSNKVNKIKGRKDTDYYNSGWFCYNGLDRIDSKLNHTINNIVPCCFICNRAKGNMSVDEFKLWINKIYNHTLNNHIFNLR